MQPDSSHEQLQIYTNWANYYLRKTGHDPAVRDLQADLRDGVLLSRIIEGVFESKIVGITHEPSNQTQELDNLSSCLDFIRDREVSIDDVTSPDVHTGSLDAIFSLFYVLTVYRKKNSSLQCYQDLRALNIYLEDCIPRRKLFQRRNGYKILRKSFVKHQRLRGITYIGPLVPYVSGTTDYVVFRREAR
eukprot:TRINITY_DN925_c1_g1_i4.p1 TRINITY_DN925_c1_g1~~TRINITY_DN925_c1_g1_i4.p1  ORF type:complete len:189 (-),score=25.97 TRINITY_DN925_c1_g1_i4:104-670(-)